MPEPTATTPPVISDAPTDHYSSDRLGVDPFAGAAPASTLEAPPPPELNTPERFDTSPEKPAAPVVPEPKTEPAPPVWSVDKLLEETGIKGLKPGDKRFTDWKAQKDFTGNVIKINESQALKIAAYEQEKSALQQELEAAKKGGSNPNPVEAQAIQAELAALKAAHEAEVGEYREWKAKHNLETNESFKREFDGKRVELFTQAKETATEVGLDPAKLDAVFEAKSELQLRKAVKELELEDEDAEALILEKALGYSKLTQQRDNMLSGKSGKTASQLATEYEAHMAQFSGVMSKQLTTELQGQLLTASSTALSRLADKSSLFKTEHGHTVVDEITQRFRAGYDLDAESVVDALALARIAPVWEKQAMAVAAENVALKKQVDALTKGLPGGEGFRSSNGGGQAPRAQAPDPWAPREGIDPHAKAG